MPHKDQIKCYLIKSGEYYGNELDVFSIEERDNLLKELRARDKKCFSIKVSPGKDYPNVHFWRVFKKITKEEIEFEKNKQKKLEEWIFRKREKNDMQ